MIYTLVYTTLLVETTQRHSRPPSEIITNSFQIQFEDEISHIF